jgi:hypothetical protein
LGSLAPRYSTFTIWAATGLSVPGLFLLVRRRIPIALYLMAVAAIYPLLYYVVVSDVRYRYPLLWLSLLCPGYLLENLVAQRSTSARPLSKCVESKGIGS